MANREQNVTVEVLKQKSAHQEYSTQKLYNSEMKDNGKEVRYQEVSLQQMLGRFLCSGEKDDDWDDVNM